MKGKQKPEDIENKARLEGRCGGCAVTQFKAGEPFRELTIFATTDKGHEVVRCEYCDFPEIKDEFVDAS